MSRHDEGVSSEDFLGQSVKDAIWKFLEGVYDHLFTFNCSNTDLDHITKHLDAIITHEKKVCFLPGSVQILRYDLTHLNDDRP